MKKLNRKQAEWAYTKWCEGYALLQIAEAFDCCDKTIVRAINGRPRIRPLLHYDGKTTLTNDQINTKEVRGYGGKM